MPTPVTAISGIGPATAELLANHGFKTAESIANTTTEKLSLVPGFGEIRSADTIKAAIEAVGAEPAAEKPKTTKKKPEAKAKKEKPEKNKKKDKKKDKKKKEKTKDKKKDKKKKDKTKDSKKGKKKGKKKK